MTKLHRISAWRFTHVALCNWRNFTNVAVTLPQRVFLVGPNASGKSNLLDALRFLRDLVAVGGGLQEAVRRRGGVTSLRSLAARRYADIVMQVEVGNDEAPAAWRYELIFNQDHRSRPIIKAEKVFKMGQGMLERPDHNDRQDPERLTQTYLEQVYANQAFRAVAEVFASIRYLHVVPQLIREPERSVGKVNDPFGETVAELPGLSSPCPMK